MNQRMLSETGARLLGTLVRFWRSIVPPEGASSKTVLAANALRTTLAGLLAWLVLQFGLFIPFLVVRKAATFGFSLALLLSLLASLHYLRRGRVKLASWILVSTLWLHGAADAALAGGISSHSLVGLLAVTVVTAWLFEYEVTLIGAGLLLGMTLGMALLENAGVGLPRYFPNPPLVVWSLLCLYIAVAILPLSQVFRALHQALGETRGHATFNQAVRDSLTAHIAVIDANGVIITTNRAWDRFAIENGGSSPEKNGLGASYLDACAQAASAGDLLAQQALAGLQAVQDGVLDCFDVEYPCDSPSERRWFAMHATRLGSGGRSLVVSHQNITYCKRVQEEMSRNQVLLRVVLDGTVDPVFLKDRQSRVVLANPATLHAIGKPAEQVLGKTDCEFYDDPETGRAMMENDRRIVETGRAESMEETVPTPEGSRIFLSTKSPYYDAEGRIIGVIGVARDITERKRAEESLRYANAYNRSLFEASLDPLLTIGADGKITDVNRATEEATGHAREELVGTDFPNYFTEPARAQEGYERVFREGVVRDYPLELRQRGGSVRSVLYNASTYRDEGGQVIGVFAAARDVTAAKQAEQKRLEYLRELERWRKATLGREERVRELKGEIDRLLARLGEPPRYTGTV
jgi:PAS domain S-box-containing protein